jgi:hypothetical protein
MPTTAKSIATAKSKIDFKKAFKMRYLNGLTYQDIADKFHVTSGAVQQLLKPIKNIIDKADLYPVYKSNANELQEIAESLLLQEMLSKEKLQKASVNNLAYAYDKMIQARKGQTTGNVAITVELVFQEAEQEARRIRAKRTDIKIDKSDYKIGGSKGPQTKK